MEEKINASEILQPITVPARQVRKMIKALENVDDDTKVPFEYIMTALFPSVFYNIQEEMNKCYMKGYLQGKEEK